MPEVLVNIYGIDKDVVEKEFASFLENLLSEVREKATEWAIAFVNKQRDSCLDELSIGTSAVSSLTQQTTLTSTKNEDTTEKL